MGGKCVLIRRLPLVLSFGYDLAEDVFEAMLEIGRFAVSQVHHHGLDHDLVSADNVLPSRDSTCALHHLVGCMQTIECVGRYHLSCKRWKSCACGQAAAIEALEVQ